MMTAESGDSGEKWRNLRDVYRIPSTRLSNELDDKVTEREKYRMMRFLAWSLRQILISLTEMENKERRSRPGVWPRDDIGFRRDRAQKAGGKNC